MASPLLRVRKRVDRVSGQGAGRSLLIRQFPLEGLVLEAVAGALGLLAAAWTAVGAVYAAAWKPGSAQ